MTYQNQCLPPPFWYQTVVRSFRTSDRREADIVGKPALVEFDRIRVRRHIHLIHAPAP